MGFSTSPYQNNDYQAASAYRPYELPINDIFKGISAQNAFWDAGAARIKSVYDTALNLKLSLAPNKQMRDQFMQDSEKELSKLSTMNVADPSIQRQGINVFKPLLKDEGMLYDDAMTRHFDKVRTDALQYREKEGGKGFHENNLRYAMDGYEEFVNSQDRMAGKKFYEKRKEYTPYYDPTQELSSILKNCGHNSFENESPLYNNGEMTGYSTRTKDESFSAEKVNGCLDGMLSEKAKRQLQIDGYVTYKNNPEALAERYTKFAANSLNYLQKQFDADVVAKVAGLEAKVKRGQKLSANEQKEYDTYMAISETYTKQIDGFKNQLGSIANGDYGFLTENMEKYAGYIHMQDIVKGWADGASYEKISRRQVADPVQLTHIKYRQDLNLQNDRQNFEREENSLQRQHDINKLMLEQTMKGMGGNGKLKKNADGSYSYDISNLESYNEKDLTGDDVAKYGQKEFEDELTQVSSQLREVNDYILSQLQNSTDVVTFPDGTKVDVRKYIQEHPEELNDLANSTFISNYLKSGGADPSIKNYINQQMHLKNKQNLFIRKQTNIENQLKAENPDLYNRTALTSIKPVTVEGVQITAQDIADVLEGKSVKGIQISTSVAGYGSSRQGGMARTYDITINGKPTYSIKGGGDLKILMNRVVTAHDKISSELKSKRESKYNEANYEIGGFKQIVTPQEELQNVLERNLTSEQKKDINVSQVAFNGSGKVIVQVAGMKEKEAVLYLQGLGLGADAPKPLGNGKYMIKTDSFFKVQGAAQEADDTVVKLLTSMSRHSDMANPKVRAGTTIETYPQTFMTSKGLETADIVLVKGVGGVPVFDLYIKNSTGRHKQTVSGPVNDPQVILQLLKTYQAVANAR